MSSGFTCTICSEKYKSTDEIYSTTCGHIFHLQCMMQWKSRSTSCPQCRAYNPESHKIYLNIEENVENKENETKLLDLKKQLEEEVLHVSNLERQLEKNELDLKKQLEKNVLLISNLEHQLEQSENNFFELQKQCSQYDDEVAKLNNTIKYLKIQNEGQEKDILLKIKESTKLKEELQRKALTLDNADLAVSEMALMQKNKVLQQKLEQMSVQLEIEMRNSVELSLEKIRLENKLKHHVSIATNNNNTNRMIRRSESAYNLSNANSNNQVKDKNMKQNMALKNNSSASLPTHADDIDNNRSIIIKNIPKLTDHTSSITQLALKMNIKCERSDIEKAFILQKNFYMRHHIQPETLTLVVEFKTDDLKTRFLANKDMQRNYPDTRQIIIYEYINENTNPLFHYAKTLRRYGYKFIYIKNGSVFAKMFKNSPSIKIRNAQHVDDLTREIENKDQDYVLL